MSGDYEVGMLVVDPEDGVLKKIVEIRDDGALVLGLLEPVGPPEGPACIAPQSMAGGGTTKLSAADLRRILHALLVSVLEVRQMVAGASTTLSVDDYGDALLGATRRLQQMEVCVRGLLAAKVEMGAEDLSAEAQDAERTCDNCGRPATCVGTHVDAGPVYSCAGCAMTQGRDKELLNIRPLPKKGGPDAA